MKTDAVMAWWNPGDLETISRNTDLYFILSNVPPAPRWDMNTCFPRCLPEQDEQLARTLVEGLLQLPMLSSDAVAGSGAAYAMSKHANHVQVEAASLTWGKRGARVNSISPGIVLTPLARDEMSGPGAAGAWLDERPRRRRESRRGRRRAMWMTSRRPADRVSRS